MENLVAFLCRTMYIIYYLYPVTITFPVNLMKCTLNDVIPPLQESCHSINSLLYAIVGVRLSQMFLHESISRINWTISYYHHIQIQWHALTKDGEIILEIRMLSKIIVKILIKIETCNLAMYCITFQNITWPGQILQLLFVPPPYRHSFSVPGTISFNLFQHSFYMYIQTVYIICWGQWEDSFGYNGPSISIDNKMFYYCLISIAFMCM